VIAERGINALDELSVVYREGKVGGNAVESAHTVHRHQIMP
jgi:hypothetical protein